MKFLTYTTDMPVSIVQEAYNFSKNSHNGQVRKYTGVPYFHHIKDVVSIVEDVLYNRGEFHNDFAKHIFSIAYLHDVVEYCNVTFEEISSKFGSEICEGVRLLSNLEKGNRKHRKSMERQRLSVSPNYIQMIKCADIISNVRDIVKYDYEFSKVYIDEKRELLDVMLNAGDDIMFSARQCLGIGVKVEFKGKLI